MALIGTVMSMALGGFNAALNTVRGDANMNIVVWQFKLARETAINQRRSVEIQFTPPNFISVVRRNLPLGTTVLSTAVLEHQTQFYAFSTMPDTPDGFGKTGAISFGGANAMMFNADGQFTDGNGNVLNGTLFIGKASAPLTARAVTVFGPISAIRGYRWNGTAWTH